ncbi:amidohydrolase family protein [Neobacillus sp. YIM B02564]|uniref:Amidohydrolase family protein n=1 Tax=Neobacillus paridis TaxID=2803862 RepID=A0ABS1TSQ1_9BACI|nr:amidohydrolase family protein [Neobacillus paridis]MBL4954323.1 amidohydrolase family protein [Neobacillus paridis]
MFIDIHVHPNFYEGIDKGKEMFALRQKGLNIHKNSIATIQHVKNQMKCAGLDKLCLLAQDESSLYGQPLVSNQEVAGLVNQAPELFFGFASVDPLTDHWEEELYFAFQELHLNGLSLNLSKLKLYPTDDRLQRLYEICLEEDKPILFHCGCSYEHDTVAKYSHPLEFEEVASSYPKLRIGLEHFGWPWVKDTAMLMLKYQNVYVDTAALFFDNALEFYRYIFTKEYEWTWVERSLRHQIMFGSDNPRFEQIRMAHALDELGFSKKTLDLIKGENAMEFMGIKNG